MIHMEQTQTLRLTGPDGRTLSARAEAVRDADEIIVVVDHGQEHRVRVPVKIAGSGRPDSGEPSGLRETLSLVRGSLPSWMLRAEQLELMEVVKPWLRSLLVRRYATRTLGAPLTLSPGAVAALWEDDRPYCLDPIYCRIHGSKRLGIRIPRPRQVRPRAVAALMEGARDMPDGPRCVSMMDITSVRPVSCLVVRPTRSYGREIVWENAGDMERTARWQAALSMLPDDTVPEAAPVCLRIAQWGTRGVLPEATLSSPAAGRLARHWLYQRLMHDGLAMGAAQDDPEAAVTIGWEELA